MTTDQLEQRIARLEDEFEKMKAYLRCTTSQGWRAVVGSHERSATFDSVVREMRRIRREEHKEAAKEADSRE